MVELAQACKSIQVAATVEINGALAQMLDAEITPPLVVVNQKNKNIPNSGLKQRNGKENCTNNHDHQKDAKNICKSHFRD